MTNTLLDLMLKNGAVSFYGKGESELTLQLQSGRFAASYCVHSDWGKKRSRLLFEGEADSLLAFLQEVCLWLATRRLKSP